MRAALMIIDLQKAYCGESAKASMNSAAEYINSVLPYFRERKLPVIWVQHLEEESGAEPGKEGFDFIDALKPEPQEYRVHKRYRNSFNKTDCLDIVKKEGVDTLIVAGYCAEYCIQATCVGALDHDLLPILLKNGIASDSEANLRVIESVNESVSAKALKRLLG